MSRQRGRGLVETNVFEVSSPSRVQMRAGLRFRGVASFASPDFPRDSRRSPSSATLDRPV